jgi:hypothetical protein
MLDLLILCVIGSGLVCVQLAIFWVSSSVLKRQYKRH